MCLVIFVFFLVYTTSAFVSDGKLFQVVFNIPSDNELYTKLAVVISAAIIITYTLMGGFNAVAWTDFIQGLIMVIAIVALPIGLINATDDFNWAMVTSTAKLVSDGADASGFGAAFGPAIIFSLYWKRLTLKGTVAGIIGGAVTVLVWDNILGLSSTVLYSIVPGFIVSCILTVVVSLIDKEPSKEVLDMFEEASKEN